jgi:hypothetical protein
LEVAPATVGRKLRCPDCGEEFICRLPKAIVVDGQPRSEELVVLADELDASADELAALSEAMEAGPPLEPPAPAKPDTGPRPKRAPDREPPARLARDGPRQWHVVVGGVPAVALSYGQLVRRAAWGEIKPKTKIYYAPKDLTLSAGDIPGLFAEIDARRANAGEARPAESLKGVSPAAAALADALGSLGSPGRESPRPAGGAGAGKAPDAQSDEVQALADALGEIEKDKGK